MKNIKKIFKKVKAKVKEFKKEIKEAWKDDDDYNVAANVATFSTVVNVANNDEIKPQIRNVVPQINKVNYK